MAKLSMPDDETELLDTQLISYALKGRQDLSVTGKAISAISANEFLLVQSTNYVQANYYVPLLLRLGMSVSPDGQVIRTRTRMPHAFNKATTDRVTLEFGSEFPTVVEYGNLAIARVINRRDSSLFYAAIEFLDKAQRKTVRRRFDFLLDNEITCIPLSKNAISTGMELLQAFTAQYNLKANFRNSLNDILVVATAKDASAKLVTADTLLGKFAAKHFGADSSKQGDFVALSFRQNISPSSHLSQESKGYINKGWHVSFRNYHLGAG